MSSLSGASVKRGQLDVAIYQKSHDTNQIRDQVQALHNQFDSDVFPFAKRSVQLKDECTAKFNPADLVDACAKLADELPDFMAKVYATGKALEGLDQIYASETARQEQIKAAADRLE